MRSAADSPRRVLRRFGLLCALAYVVLAWAVRFDMAAGRQIASLIYPLDTFSMYAGLPYEEIGYLLVRDADGGVREITRLTAFDCDGPVRGPAARCAEQHQIAYLRDDLTRYIEAHPGPGVTPVELVVRVWRLQHGAAAVHVSDCVVTTCRVAP